MDHTTESPGKKARMEMGSPWERGALAGHRFLVLCGVALLCGATALLAVSCSLGTAEFKDVKAEELKRMMDSGALLLIVDTRIDREYREGRLPRSVNIPPPQVHADRAVPASGKGHSDRLLLQGLWLRAERSGCGRSAQGRLHKPADLYRRLHRVGPCGLPCRALTSDLSFFLTPRFHSNPSCWPWRRR